MDSSSTTADSEFGETLIELARFVDELTYEDIPEAVIEIEKRHVLDTLGCILYGNTTPWVRKVVRTCERLGETGPVSVLGTDSAVPPRAAALINGTASHSMDYDDHCQDAGVHAGSATLPTALAHAEFSDRAIDGKEFLTAIVAGVEVGIRSGYGVGYGSVARGWHIAGWTDAFAGAATVGKLYDLDVPELAHALAIGGTQGCGLLGAQYGAEVKRFHMGKAAEAGYLGAALARESFTGDTKIFEERYGAVGTTMSDDYDNDAVVDGLGERYRILDKLTFKPFPSVGQVHAPVDAVMEVLEEQNIDPRDVTRVTVRATPTVKDHVGWNFEPKGVMSAQSNIQYAVATLLVDGAVTIDAYTEEAIRRPEILDRIESVDVVVDESLAEETFGSIVEVTVGEQSWENAVHTPRGYPSNPLTDEEIETKFRNQAEKSVSDEAIDALIERIDDLEHLDDIRELTALC